MVSYLSNSIMPIMILFILGYALKEKVKVYDTFLEGAKEGMEMVFGLLPTLVGIFVAIGALRSSGILDLIVKGITPICQIFDLPSQIMPFALIRPISGSASMAIAVDIMGKWGVDSQIGMIASTIMGSTETTLYTIAIYTACVKIKKIKFTLATALIADFVGILTSILICKIL